MTVEKSGTSTVVHVDGEINMATAPTLRACLDRALTEDAPDAVIVDAAAVRFVSSAGLAALVRAHSRAEEAGTRFAVVITAGEVAERAITITNLDRMFRVVNDADQAVAGTR